MKATYHEVIASQNERMAPEPMADGWKNFYRVSINKLMMICIVVETMVKPWVHARLLKPAGGNPCFLRAESLEMPIL